jgi:hypothetical protein
MLPVLAGAGLDELRDAVVGVVVHAEGGKRYNTQVFRAPSTD